MELKYYMKPNKWIDWIEESGSRRREMAEVTPALECQRNSENWSKVDVVEYGVSNSSR